MLAGKDIRKRVKETRSKKIWMKYKFTKRIG